MKTILMVALVLSFVLAVTAAPTLVVRAQSCVGVTHGVFANVNGNLGWLGPLGGRPGYHGAVGQEPGATRYNNSTAGPDCLGN